jgi:hypothetical protein
MRLRYFVIPTLAIAAAAFYVGVKPGVKEFKEVDELGERHEVVVAGPYVVIKHGPGAHQRDFNRSRRRNKHNLSFSRGVLSYFLITIFSM